MPLLSARFLFVLPFLAFASCAAPFDEADIASPGAGMARLGEQMREKGDLGGAMDFYHRALANDPANLIAIKGLGATLEAWGDKIGAAEAYRKGVLAQPDNGELRRLYGKALIALDEPAKAREQFVAALDIDDKDTKARGGLGVALDYLGEHVKAQKQYEKALREDPDNLSLTNNMAYSYILSRNYRRAIELLEPFADVREASPAMRQNLALAYGLAGMDVDAERVAKKDLTPEQVREHMNYYRAQRIELSISKAPYAELGTYATEGMALAQIEKIRPEIKKTGGDLKAVVLPQVSSPGGTPRFTVRMMGCSRPDDVSRLCKTLAQSGIPCVARGKGGE